MVKKLLYEDDVYRHCLERINSITEDTVPQWGKMDAAQMMSHCAEIQEVSNGKALENTPFLAKLFKGMIRKMVVNDQPYPKNTRTHPQYLQKSIKNFETERDRLINALEQFREMDGEQALKVRHPLFGTMTREEKGWSAFKHLDHHLKQFGV